MFSVNHDFGYTTTHPNIICAIVEKNRRRSNGCRETINIHGPDGMIVRTYYGTITRIG